MKWWAITVVAALMVISGGCQLAPHQVDLLHQRMLGLAWWSNYDTKGFLIGVGQVSRATRSPLTNSPAATLGVFRNSPAEDSREIFPNGTQLDLVCLTNKVTQFTVLISSGPIVLGVRSAP